MASTCTAVRRATSPWRSPRRSNSGCAAILTLQGACSSALQLCAALATGAALACGGLAFALLQADRRIAAYLSVYAIAAMLALVAALGVKRALTF
jgi:hypothetical protein